MKRRTFEVVQKEYDIKVGFYIPGSEGPSDVLLTLFLNCATNSHRAPSSALYAHTHTSLYFALSSPQDIFFVKRSIGNVFFPNPEGGAEKIALGK